MLTESIAYLRRSDSVVSIVLIGGLLTMFAWVIVPWFVVLGYLVRVLDRTSHGNEDPPRFEDWGDLLADGFRAFVITFAYGLIPLVLGLLFVGVGITGGVGLDRPRAFGLFGFLFGGLVTLVVTLLISYIVPAALANFVDRDSIGAGFDFDRLKVALLTETYAVGWLTAAVVVIAGAIAAAIVGAVPVVGWIAGPFVMFYTYVSAFFVIGRTWADVRVEGSQVTPSHVPQEPSGE